MDMRGSVIEMIVRGLEMKFRDWCENTRRNKKYKEDENCFISIQSNFCLLEYICSIDKMFLKTVSKGLQRKNV
jgi:hypothetical protein